MSGRRGERVTRPARNGEWTLRYASRDVAIGWEGLCRQQAGVLAGLYDRLTSDPRAVDNPERHGRLRGALAVAAVGGAALEQWQYEIAGGGRIWFAIDDSSQTVWLTLASARHPNETK